MYTSKNFKTKKVFKEAVADGEKITIYSPGLGTPKRDGKECVEGPWYPAPHSWYATVVVENYIVKSVK